MHHPMANGAKKNILVGMVMDGRFYFAGWLCYNCG
jgi:hypothetical protein